MLKCDEFASDTSCLNEAYADEMLFVLLARDEAAPDTVRDWAARRIAKGLNSSTDKKITSALACADRMEQQQAKMRARRDSEKAEVAECQTGPKSST